MPLVEADSILESLWERDAVVWDRYWVPVFRLFARELIRSASPSPGDLILDLGTGSGVAAIETSKSVQSLGLVVGIDRSDAMITLARRKVARAGLSNVRFIKMSGEDLRFPDGFFDIAISNCGIGIYDFSRGLKEILRVLRPGGVLVFNDWHLIDVKPHRTFGEVLGKCRTGNPSPQLALERSALACTESYHHSLSSDRQVKMVNDIGFSRVRFSSRRYRVRMHGTTDYIKMRLCRAAIRHEISEMPMVQRKLFLSELTTRLRKFVKRTGFVFDWNVFYICGKKPF